MIKLNVNNGRTMELDQKQVDGTVIVSQFRTDKEIESVWPIPAGDMVMLINYYRYVKNNNVHCDFINPNGKEQ